MRQWIKRGKGKQPPYSVFLSVVIVLLVVGLAACANNGAQEPPSTAEPPLFSETPFNEETLLPVDTPVATGAITPTIQGDPDLTPGAATPVVETPAVEATESVETPAAAATAEVGLPVTGGPQALLSSLIGRDARGPQGERIGQVSGAMLARQLLDPNEVFEEAEPLNTAPQVRYLLVLLDLESADPAAGAVDPNEAVPSATPPAGASEGGVSEATAAPGGGTGTNPIAQRGLEVILPWNAFNHAEGQGAASQADALTVIAEPQAVANAPRTDPNVPPDFEDPAWEEALRAYWDQQGLPVPVTGAGEARPSHPVRVQDALPAIPVIAEDGTTIGQVVDMITELENGLVSYLVVATEAGERQTIAGPFLVIPSAQLSWINERAPGPVPDAQATEPGEIYGFFQIYFPAEELSDAPAFDTVDEIDLENFAGPVDDYWDQHGLQDEMDAGANP